MTTLPADRDLRSAQHASLSIAAQKHGTPAYLTDIATVVDRAAKVEAAFPAPWILQYSLKANDVPALVARLAARGWGANVVSLGEWRLAKAAGVPNQAISLEGIGKTDAELQAVAQAIADGHPLRWVALESADEVEALGAIVSRLNADAPGPEVLLRLNPQVSPETLAGLAVGKPSSKFGMTESELLDAATMAPFADGTLRLRGIHVHVGSQLNGVAAWASGGLSALTLLDALKSMPHGSDVDTVDFGGGFPAGLPNAPEPRDFAAALQDAIKAVGRTMPARMAIEPGRYPVAEAGWLLATVLHVRERSSRQQVVVNAGMTELVRPALYGAEHAVVPLGETDAATSWVETDVEGPVCESADSLGRHLLPRLKRGDHVAVAVAGAYGSSFSSRYNGRSRPAELALELDGSLVEWRRSEPVL